MFRATSPLSTAGSIGAVAHGDVAFARLRVLLSPLIFAHLLINTLQHYQSPTYAKIASNTPLPTHVDVDDRGSSPGRNIVVVELGRTLNVARINEQAMPWLFTDQGMFALGLFVTLLMAGFLATTLFYAVHSV